MRNKEVLKENIGKTTVIIIGIIYVFLFDTKYEEALERKKAEQSAKSI